jgi:hypothetical protein
VETIHETYEVLDTVWVKGLECMVMEKLDRPDAYLVRPMDINIDMETTAQHMSRTPTLR